MSTAFDRVASDRSTEEVAEELVEVPVDVIGLVDDGMSVVVGWLLASVELSGLAAVVEGEVPSVDEGASDDPVVVGTGVDGALSVD